MAKKTLYLNHKLSVLGIMRIILLHLFLGVQAGYSMDHKEEFRIKEEG